MVKPNAAIFERVNPAFESNKLWLETSMRATSKFFLKRQSNEDWMINNRKSIMFVIPQSYVFLKV